MISKTKLKELLASGNTFETIQQLLEVTNNTSLFNEVIQQSAKFEYYQRTDRLGTHSTEQSNIILSRVNESLLQIIDKLPNDLPASKKSIIELPETIIKSKNKTYLQLGLVSLIGLVIFIGIKSTNSAMQLTVYVHGVEGKQDYVLENEGELIVDIRNDRRAAIIGENGRTNFGEIPKYFKGTKVPILVKAKGFLPVFPDSLYKLDGTPIYFALKKDQTYRTIKGIVKNEDGTFPLEGVEIEVEGIKEITDTSGSFVITVPEKSLRDEYQVTASKKGFRSITLTYYPGSTPIPFRLEEMK